MKYLMLSAALAAMPAAAGPEVYDLSLISAPPETDNIHVQRLASDSHSSQFLIFVKEEVRPHIHKEHTETLYVLEGEGVLRLEKSSVPIKTGHFIQIPANTVHGVRVTSAGPLKVLSIQAPEFLGKDRVFVEG